MIRETVVEKSSTETTLLMDDFAVYCCAEMTGTPYLRLFFTRTLVIFMW